MMAQHDITHTRQGSFQIVLGNAEPGDEIIYHIGEFCAGPHKAVALNSAEAGMCILYQRRHGKRQFAYIAKKPKEKIKPRRNDLLRQAEGFGLGEVGL